MSTDVRYSVKMTPGIKKWGFGWIDSLAQICQPAGMQSLAGGYRYYINKFVPKESGTLRKEAKAVSKIGGDRGAGGNGTGSATIYWGYSGKSEKYAHYQFIGDVYGPNKAVVVNGEHRGWRSPKGKNQKYNTHRKMGEPFEYELHDGTLIRVKGYTVRGTGYNWIKKFQEDGGDFGEKAINIRAGRYLYEMFCVKSHPPIKPVGGLRVYRSWNQIKHRTG